MNTNRLFSLFSLATKAGKIVSGEFATEKEIKSGKAHIAIIATDASNNTKKKFRNMCEFYEVPFYTFGTKDELGHYIGKEFRASLAILDAGFTKSVIKYLEEQPVVSMENETQVGGQ